MERCPYNSGYNIFRVFRESYSVLHVCAQPTRLISLSYQYWRPNLYWLLCINADSVVYMLTVHCSLTLLYITQLHCVVVVCLFCWYLWRKNCVLNGFPCVVVFNLVVHMYSGVSLVSICYCPLRTKLWLFECIFITLCKGTRVMLSVV